MLLSRARKKNAALSMALVLGITGLLAGCGGTANDKPAAQAPASPASEDTGKPKANQSPEEYWAEVVEKGKKEGTVNIGTSLGQNDLVPVLTEAMNRLYGIKVVSEPMDDARNIAKMKAEDAAENYQRDIASLKYVYIKDNPNLVGDFGYIPELEKGKWAIDMKANAPGLIVISQSFGLGVNTQMFPDGSQPKSIKELADPKYKGKIVLQDPSGLSGSTEWVARILEIYGEEWLKQFYANCVVLPVEAAPTIRQKVVSGEYGINPIDGWSAPPFLAKNPGVPYKFYMPEEGTFSRIATIALAKNAPHPNAARLLVNWLLSPEGQAAAAKAAAITPLRIGTQPLPYSVIQDLDKMKFIKPFPDTLEFSTTKLKQAADLSKKLFTELNIKVQGN